MGSKIKRVRLKKTNENVSSPLPRDKNQLAKERTGGWWYNIDTRAHLTGVHTNSRLTMGFQGHLGPTTEKQIYYFWGGERLNGTGQPVGERQVIVFTPGSQTWDSW